MFALPASDYHLCLGACQWLTDAIPCPVVTVSMTVTVIDTVTTGSEVINQDVKMQASCTGNGQVES